MFIKDIFYSFQGEGPWVGYPQIFVRFYGCNITCAYCDEPDFREDREKVAVDTVLERIREYDKKPVHSISITGGEPLIQVEALKQLCPELPHPLYLETNGTLPDHLAEVVDLFDYFSVDYKPGFEREFTDFMAVLRDRPNVFVKFIVLKRFPTQQMEFLTKTIAAMNPEIPLVLQPVTPFSQIKEKAHVDDITRAYTIASKRLKDVRIIPQTHKFMGLK